MSLTLNGREYSKMILAGAHSLKRHVKEINDLNVFPIPDGDTGDNMLLTMLGGENAASADDVSTAARKIADGMLLSARGNSGVILSQFFDGIAAGFDGVTDAAAGDFKKAFTTGVKHAYRAVMEPTEGTILTVIREASAYAETVDCEDPAAYLTAFIQEAKASLERTPELLPVLKKAGVVDSGGAGLICIAEGMLAVLNGEDIPDDGAFSHDSAAVMSATHQDLDLDLFNEDSVLEFGYCTELLLRLQNIKTNPATFNIEIIKDYLKDIGNSVVIFQTGSIVKLHVHTMTPDKVLAFCQQFGEFLTVKIENMSLQHNNLEEQIEDDSMAINEATRRATLAGAEKKPYAIVAVAAGAGIQETFRELGADVIVDGGQSMNPSSEAFIDAFDSVSADTIFVLPNNGNVVLAALQAAKLYDKADIRVIQTKTIGEGYAALTMYSPDEGCADDVEEALNFATEGVITAEVSRCARDSEFGDLSLKEGQYIGFVGKEILASGDSRRDAVNELCGKLDFSDHEICILIAGRGADKDEADAIRGELEASHRNTEVYLIDGKQDIYDYILILE